MASRHPHETTGRRPRATHRRPRRPGRSTSRRRSPPRTVADPHVAPLRDDQANASAPALPGQIDAASASPSQLLTIEALQRPLESAGLVSVGVVAIDGTKMSANAAINSNRDFGQIAREILEVAAEIDRREDELCGSERGDELPEHLRTREGRRKAFCEAKERLEREREADQPVENEDAGEVAVELDPEKFVTRPQGRRAWLREGRRGLDAERERQARPIPQERADRLSEACRRLEEELDVEQAFNAA